MELGTAYHTASFKEELGAFVIQLDTAHWQHELQILSTMSTNKDLKVSASGTLNRKRIIRPLDSTTHLWLQSCTCISQNNNSSKNL